MILAVSPARTIDQAVAGWLQGQQSQGTRRTYQSVLLAFRASLQSYRLDLDSAPELVADHLQVWLTHALTPTRPPALRTVSVRGYVVRSFYRYAVRRRYLAENPALLVAIPTAPLYAGVQGLPLAEVQARLAQVDRTTLQGQRDYALVGVYLVTGRRFAEVAGLTLGDLTLDGAQVTLTFHTKGGGQHRDTLPAAVAQALMTYLAGADALTGPASAALWRRTDRQAAGAPLLPPGVRDAVQRVLAVTRVHRLRHTFAARMLALGATVPELAGRLGHRNLAVTTAYATALTEDVNRLGDELATTFGLQASAS